VDGTGRIGDGRRWSAVREPSECRRRRTSAEPTDLNGYTIVEAGSLDEAHDLIKAHPFLSEGKGRFTIDIYELVPMQM
jgi:hypothetical protein